MYLNIYLDIDQDLDYIYGRAHREAGHDATHGTEGASVFVVGDKFLYMFVRSESGGKLVMSAKPKSPAGVLSSTLGVARCGRSAGCVLCALWAVPAVVLGGGGGYSGGGSHY